MYLPPDPSDPFGLLTILEASGPLSIIFDSLVVANWGLKFVQSVHNVLEENSV